MQHAKPALSITNQLTLLEQRGMLIDDASQAAHALAHISYYRLRAYWLPYEAAINSASHPHRFKTGTRFSTILAVYEFDRHLRLHIAQRFKLKNARNHLCQFISQHPINT